MRYCVKKLAVCALLWSMCVVVFPQAAYRSSVKDVTAFVTDFRAPYDRMVVTVIENDVTKEDTWVFAISPGTLIVNKKNKPLDRAMIRPGMEVELVGDRVGTEFQISRIKLKIDHEKWEAEADGYFEALEGDKAWIDGRAVKLGPGTTIKGKGSWENRRFASFNDIHAGSVVKIKGIRRDDGIIYAKEAEAQPNEFTNGDQKMLDLVRANMVMPTTQLEGGKGKVGGKEVTFVNDRRLQQYVTVTCTPKITPGGRQESNRIEEGDFCDEKGIYG